MENRNRVLKRVLACVMVVLMAVTAVPMSGFVGLELPKWSEVFSMRASAADTYTEGYYTYMVTDGKATITDCDNSISGNVVIPDTLGGYPVTIIDGQYVDLSYSGAFSDCTRLTSVLIPNSVTSVGRFAFYNCKSLVKVLLPEGLKNIGNSAFDSCKGLVRVEIPDSVESVGVDAFYGCTNLESITIGKGVTNIGRYSFYNCTSLSEINWNSENVSDFDDQDNVFYNAGTETDGIEVVFGDNVKNIPDYVFHEYVNGGYKSSANIKSVTIGAGVKRIGECAFSKCTSLKQVYWNAEKVDSCITPFLYAGTTTDGMTVVFGDNAKNIPDGAFSNCRLKSITIGNGITSIGSYAFRYCTGLTRVTIPNSVTSIGSYAFSYCTGLTKINWNAENIKDFIYEDEWGDIVNSTVFDNAGTAGNGMEVVFGDSVKRIPAYAFYNCYSLTSIVAAEGVEYIGRKAFDGTTWFDVRSNGDIYVGRFYYKYKGIMPKNTSIEIKDDTKGIAASAFEDCTELTDILIPNSVKNIGDSAFKDCNNLTNIIMPDSITIIGDSTFYNCTHLSEITIPNSVASIGDSAFYNCIGIENIAIPESVKIIGKGAFQACRNLAYVLLENGVENIGEKAFENSAIKEMILPDSVTNIDAGAFSKCISLARVTVGKGIDTIKGGYIDNGNYCYGTFENCTNLTTIKLETNIKTIEANAFNGIENIPEIYYAGSEDDWKNISIDQSNDMILRATVQYNADLTHEHSYTETVTTSATCTENGVKTFTCDCGKIYTEEIPATGHTSSEWIEDKAATCVNEGKKHKECTVCQTVLENGTISANGHDFESDIIPATCTSIGYETKTCKTCGECHFVRAISANGHTPSDWIVDYDVTCTSDGLRHKECTVCNMIIESETIYAVSHKYRTETTAATCMANGYEIMICADCGETEFVRSIPAKGHTLKTTVIPATFTESGLSIVSCRTCGMITKATLIKRIASVSLSRTAFTYNGKVQTPTVVVKDSAGKVLKYKTDYTVSYASGRKTPGKYAVKITFKGYYAGTKTLYFTIAPATPTLTVAAGAKKAALKWNKQVGATGYVVYMATSKTGKYSRIAVLKGNSAVSYTKTGLTTGKTYYFKVAAYTTSGGSNIYSSFSAVKGIKVK